MSTSNMALGTFFSVAGILFLLDELEIIDIRFGLLWPLLLVTVGVAILIGALRKT